MHILFVHSRPICNFFLKYISAHDSMVTIWLCEYSNSSISWWSFCKLNISYSYNSMNWTCHLCFFTILSHVSIYLTKRKLTRIMFADYGPQLWSTLYDWCELNGHESCLLYMTDVVYGLSSQMAHEQYRCYSWNDGNGHYVHAYIWWPMCNELGFGLLELNVSLSQ